MKTETIPNSTVKLIRGAHAEALRLAIRKAKAVFVYCSAFESQVRVYKNDILGSFGDESKADLFLYDDGTILIERHDDQFE